MQVDPSRHVIIEGPTGKQTLKKTDDTLVCHKPTCSGLETTGKQSLRLALLDALGLGGPLDPFRAQPFSGLGGNKSDNISVFGHV